MDQNTTNILTLTVVAALVTTSGTLFGHFLKEILLAKSFERWKTRRSVDLVYKKYRDPIVRAALDLTRRLSEICSEYPTDFLGASLLEGPSPLPAAGAERDTRFRRYKCQSTAYRLAALLAWLELYRQDIVFLDTGKSVRNRRLQQNVERIQSDLADGQLNEFDDWPDWRDSLIFREEQRAVGEALIGVSDQERTVVSYGSFVKLLEDAKGEARRWLLVVTNFFVNPAPLRDFRPVRYHRLIAHLVDLIHEMSPEQLTDDLRDTRTKSKAIMRDPCAITVHSSIQPLIPVAQ